MDLIRLVDLYKSFNSLSVLQGVDLTVKRGEIAVILGRSGTGKSVLLKHLIGLIRPDRGQVLLEGVDLVHLPEKGLFAIRKRFGYLFQHGALLDSLSIGENIAFPLREHTSLTQAQIEEIVAAKLAQVGLPGVEDKMPAELSGGMRKRAALARALALDPEIMLFDEPTTGLDPITTTTIRNLIVDTVRKLELTAVIISHDLELALSMADSIAFLHQGKILTQEPPASFRSSDLPEVQQFLQGEPD
ncbi:MAG: ABC transporter ATP-binding protein [Desulfobacteraceae bacterium]